MYLRESRQKRANGWVLMHLQLAENLWDLERKHAQVKIIDNCGRADDEETTERLRRLARSILHGCAPEEIVADSPAWLLVQAFGYGDLYVLEQLWRRVGVAEVIGEVLAGGKFAFNVERSLFAMVSNRALASPPSSTATSSGSEKISVLRARKRCGCNTSTARCISSRRTRRRSTFAWRIC